MSKRKVDLEKLESVVRFSKELFTVLCDYRDKKATFEDVFETLQRGHQGVHEPVYYTHFALCLYPCLRRYVNDTPENRQVIKCYVDEYIKNMTEDMFSSAVAETAVMYERMIMNLQTEWNKHSNS